jgi:D-alanyl-D-alanine endopeptidase (penicillin-binding protein 7)
VAESIARHFGERKFIAMMNALVADIGMKDTSFEDPSGISPHNISTAHDLTLLARYIAEKDRPVFGVSREKTADIVSSEGEHWKMQNQNVLARDDPRFLGGKLGFTTEAKRTALTVFSLSVRGEKRPVVIVVLGTDDWRKDTLALAEWVEKHP